MIGRALRALLDSPAAGPLPPVAPDQVAALTMRLAAAAQARLGRSLALLHVPTGGCNGCELELRALNGIAYDLERLGLCFVATPAQADVLLATGPLTRAMREALLLALDGMAEPRWVVAIGDCAVDGGVFKGSYAVLGGVTQTVPVDLLVRGCPPSPLQVLVALTMLVEAHAGRVAQRLLT
jgi:Ni,Fe-hydrogenase III small subunit